MKRTLRSATLVAKTATGAKSALKTKVRSSPKAGKTSKSKAPITAAPPLKKKRSSGSMGKFMRTYKGLEDFHIPLFESVLKFTKADNVLYPGCHRHLQASLVFPKVVYIDSYKGIAPEFEDDSIRAWIDEHKQYATQPTIRLIGKNFASGSKALGIQPQSFDLLISMSAGIVSTSCLKFLRPGGHFLVSDAHFDARSTYANTNLELAAVYDFENRTLQTDTTGHFETTLDQPITAAQVEESIQNPKAKRKFKLKKEALFYIFKKPLK
eukprot:m.258579 g.258579  ORF g.258579 m.258579 type:complete len:267 (-) comp36773_c0_seq1:473-1273(-)